MRRFQGWVLATAVAGVVGTAAGIGLAQAGGDDPPPLWQPAITNAAVPATTAQKHAYSVLASTQRTEDLDNARVTELADRSGVGMDAAGSRVVGATPAGPVWLIPVNGGLCLGLEDEPSTTIGAACDASDPVIAHGTTVSDGEHIYGIAPDGVGTVTVTPAASPGATTAVSVGTGGVYTLPNVSATVGVDGPVGLTELDVVGRGT
jgi:hypothetical protein